MSYKERLLIQFLGEEIYLDFINEYYVGTRCSCTLDEFFKDTLTEWLVHGFNWADSARGIGFWSAKDFEWSQFLEKRGTAC